MKGIECSVDKNKKVNVMNPEVGGVGRKEVGMELGSGLILKSK